MALLYDGRRIVKPSQCTSGRGGNFIVCCVLLALHDHGKVKFTWYTHENAWIPPCTFPWSFVLVSSIYMLCHLPNATLATWWSANKGRLCFTWSRSSFIYFGKCHHNTIVTVSVINLYDLNKRVKIVQPDNIPYLYLIIKRQNFRLFFSSIHSFGIAFSN
jgi:hypothetical protein